MISHKVITRLSAFFALVSWVVMTFSDLSVIFSFKNGLQPEVNVQIPIVAFNLFLFFVFFYYKIKIERTENVNFIDLLWRVFVTGLVATVISLFFKLINKLIGESALTQYVLFQEFIYSVNLGLISAVLISCFAVFRRLILYQKSKFLMSAWRVFQYALLISLVYNVLPFNFLNGLFNYYLVFLILLGLFLSGNMKWVAYLNFKQKWKGILLVALALFYLIYFIYWIFQHTDYMATVFPRNQVIPFVDFRENVFFFSLVAFVLIYTVFSLLVLLFNLPTSSVFEQKLEEVGNFQKLSQSIQTEQTEESIYNILLESSVSTVFAEAAWLELHLGERTVFYTYGIDESEINQIKEKLNTNRVKGIMDQGQDRTRNLDKVLREVKGTRFRSLISSPIIVKNQQIGNLALLKEVTDGFNKEMEKIISTFANQAGISIENFRLLREALENERYKEELKIAKRVQSSLLPENLEHTESFDIVAFSRAAAEVGGDYYDTFRISDKKTALIIGDVSGKGTSAAFHMSQMKGIFQSLCQLDLPPDEFLDKANTAVSKCLDKASFITATYFIIDEEEKRISFSRAGHCPTLYFNASSGKSEYFSSRGIGLGMMRNRTFHKYISVNEMHFKAGDVLVLYTDGITEAQDRKGHEYGYDRFQEMLEKNAGSSAEEIRDNIIEDLYDFTGTESINDDYTLVIVKFK